MLNMTTREKIVLARISEAIRQAFERGGRRVSDGSQRPGLTREDCDDIAAVAHHAVATAALGKFGVRTIHGGSY